MNTTPTRALLGLTLTGLLAAAPAAALENGNFADGLTGWTLLSEGGEGGATAVPGGVELREGDAFLVTLRQTFTLPPYAETLRFRLDAQRPFDLSARGLPDVFEASLLGDDGRPLVPTWRNGVTACLGVDERQALRSAPGATIDGTAATIDVRGLATGTSVTLVFALVGGDTDTGSSVTLGDVGFDLGNRPPVASAGPDRAAECGAGFTLTALSTDPDGDLLTHRWEALDGTLLGESDTLTLSPPPGTYRYRLISRDPGALTDSAELTVVVSDTTAPTLGALPKEIPLEADAACGAAAPDFLAALTATDACDDAPTREQSPAAGTRLPLGEHVITLSATDAAGNVQTHEVTVRVEDHTAPTLVQLIPPGPVAVNDVCQAATPEVVVEVADNCGEVTLTQSAPAGEPVGLGQHILTVSAVDGAGNLATGSVELTVLDTSPPQLAETAPLPVATDAACLAYAPSVEPLSAVDNCDGALAQLQDPPPGSLLPTEGAAVTVTVRDVAGNEASVALPVTLTDTQAPTLSLVEALDVPVFAGCEGVVPDVTALAEASDGCGAVSLTQDVPKGTALAVGSSVTVTVTAQDAAGNISHAASTLTASDHGAPTLSLPDTVEVVADDTCGGVVPALVPESFDACGGLTHTQTPAAGTPLVLDVATEVTVKVKDAAGNEATDSTWVTLVDHTPPTVVAPGERSVAADATCSGALPALEASVVDNCPLDAPEISSSVAVGTALSLGLPTVVELSAVDAAGNPASTAVTVSLVDTTPPTFTVEAVVVPADATCQGAVPALAPLDAVDNCGGELVVSQLPPAGEPLALGAPVSVTVTVRDAAGQETTQSVTVALVDVTPPTITLAETSLVVPPDATCKGLMPALIDFATVADNCTGADGLTLSQAPAVGAQLSGEGSTPATLSVTDGAGNPQTQAVTVAVVDPTGACDPPTPPDEDADAGPTEPDTTEPDTTEPDTTEPDTSEPDVQDSPADVQDSPADVQDSPADVQDSPADVQAGVDAGPIDAGGSADVGAPDAGSGADTTGEALAGTPGGCGCRHARRDAPAGATLGVILALALYALMRRRPPA